MKLELLPKSLLALTNPPKELFYSGNPKLLDMPKIAIIGTRRPNGYIKSLTKELARFFALQGIVVVSGGAIGTDIIAHDGAFPHTILISPSSITSPYPPSHREKIQEIAQHGLVLSEYQGDFSPMRHTFLERNRLIIALSDVIIIPQADIKSGSMQSARLAIKMNKPLYVLPHRLGESLGTQALLEQGKASLIINFQTILDKHFPLLTSNAAPKTKKDEASDELLQFFSTHPSLSEALARFGEKIFEYELNGMINIERGVVHLA